MIWNIIDHRSRPFRWKHVNAIIEAVAQDNSVFDADQAPWTDSDDLMIYDQQQNISVEEAIAWATAWRCAVTLYFYDVGP